MSVLLTTGLECTDYVSCFRMVAKGYSGGDGDIPYFYDDAMDECELDSYRDVIELFHRIADIENYVTKEDALDIIEEYGLDVQEWEIPYDYDVESCPVIESIRVYYYDDQGHCYNVDVELE